MFKFKGSTPSLLLFLFISLKLVSSRSLNKDNGLDIEVLTPNEFIVRLSQNEKGTLVNFRVNVNKELSDSGEADFEKDNVDGDVLRFDDNSLDLKKGDVIYYSGLYKDIDVYSGDAGSFIFNGVYKEPDRVKARAVRSTELSSEEEPDSDESTTIESRFGHHHHHYHGRRHGHLHGHGPPHFGPPPFPPFPHGPGPWNGNGRGHYWHGHGHGYGHGHGHGYNHNFGDNGPWDGHGQDHGFNGDQFGMHHKPCDHKGDHSNENHGFPNNKPGGGGDNVNTNVGDNGLNNNFGDNKPNKGSNSGDGNDSSDSNNGSNSVNSNASGNEGNSVEFPSTTKRPATNSVEFLSTTKRPATTETVPNIDIRFPEVKSE